MSKNNNTDLLKKLISGEESWEYGYDNETKAQTSGFATIEDRKEKSKQKLLAISKISFRMYFEDS